MSPFNIHSRRTVGAEIPLPFLLSLRLLLGLNDIQLRPIGQQRRDVIDFPKLPWEARGVQEGAHVKACDGIPTDPKNQHQHKVPLE